MPESLTAYGLEWPAPVPPAEPWPGHPGDGTVEGDAAFDDYVRDDLERVAPPPPVTDVKRLRRSLNRRRYERRCSMRYGLSFRTHSGWGGQSPQFPVVAQAERAYRSDLTLSARLRAARR